MGYLYNINKKAIDMAFKKGESGNPLGKPTGIKNRNKQPLQDRVETLLLNNFDRIEQDIEKVSPEVRLDIIGNLVGLFYSNKQTA
jgi:hypothetical protein